MIITYYRSPTHSCISCIEIGGCNLTIERCRGTRYRYERYGPACIGDIHGPLKVDIIAVAKLSSHNKREKGVVHNGFVQN